MRLRSRVARPVGLVSRGSLRQPLGHLADVDGALWIAQLSARHGEKYVVLRSDGRRAVPDVVLATAGGHCD